MSRQGSCVATSECGVVVLDRLAGLSQVIPQTVMDQALLDAGLGNQKSCLLSHRAMLWVVLAMGLLTHLSIQQVYIHATRLRPNRRIPSRSNLCEGRQRLGVEAVRRVFEQVVHPLATAATPGAFYQGLRLMAFDGTVMDTPDTLANEERFGRSSGGRGDGAFPQLRKLSLVELGTHIETALTIGGYHDSEQTLVERLFDRIPADALLLEDRGFFSYEHWKKLDAQGVKLLVRLKGNLILNRIQTLPDGSYLTKIYPSPYYRQKDREGISIRVIEYTLDDLQRTGHGEVHRLGTNLLDADKFPARELACEYHQRWEEELVFDEQKTHLDPRRPGKPTHFRSQTPEGVEQEVYALSLGHFVVRALMLAAAKQDQLDVDRLSFTGCLRVLQAALPECDSSTPTSFKEWYNLLLQALLQQRIEPRRNRVNPRVVKRKMSKFAKKRPEHRGCKPLKKTFAETVLIT
jgi:hypothetical protein